MKFPSASKLPTSGLDSASRDARFNGESIEPEYSVPIGPEPPSLLSELRELWEYRELLFFQTWRELKTRYMQTALGAIWVVLQPLAMMLIFTLFFGLLARLPSDNIPYPIFYFSGLLLWLFFAGALSGASGSLVGNTNLVTKVYFPRLILPLAAVFARMVDFAVAMTVLLGMMLFYGVSLSLQILLTFPILLLTAILTVGLGIHLAAWNVKYRDVGHILPLLLQLLMFASPIIYSAKMVPEKWRMIYMLNPMVGLVGNFRAALFGTPLDCPALTVAVLFTLIISFRGVLAFQRMEENLADVI
jgi:lipopolysaccharide transport system permease protein